MRITLYGFSLLFGFLMFSTSATAQTINFDETWKEFLENNKISNMSALVRPDKAYKPLDYAKYLLMNTNSNFCQSDVADAEVILAEIKTLDNEIPQAIPGYVGKLEQLQTRINAYHAVDIIWQQFLKTKEVNLNDLEAIPSGDRSCEKSTLAKYSYMKAYHQLCTGDIEGSKEIFETRTLRLAEKTTLRVQDVEGLAEEVARMKALYQNLESLEVAWNKYLDSGVSQGFDKELPLFPCYPIPKIKEFVLKGVVDVCTTGPEMLENIKKLQAQGNVALDEDLDFEVEELEAAIAENDNNLAALNEAWEAFLPDNQVRHKGRYGYEYCEKEPLVKAYILDGFAYVCELSEESLRKIAELQAANRRLRLDRTTLAKIEELKILNQNYKADGVEIESLWNGFVAQGDVLPYQYAAADVYCDNIHQVKDWVMRGLAGSCEESPQFLDQIEDFQRTFEFNFTKDVECRVQKLRIKIWDCRHEALQKLANIEAPDAPKARLEELMQEYGVPLTRPEECVE